MLVGFFAYVQALSGPLFFDDQPNLIDNEFVQIDGTVADDWRAAAMSSGSGPTRRPISMLTFAVNHVLFGDFSATHLKAVNLFIHGLIGLLIYGFAQAVFSSPALNKTWIGDRNILALLAAAIWLLHPLHVSTVLYAVQRMAQLSTLFMVTGLLVFCRYRLRWVQLGADSGEVIAAALWLLLLTVLAVFSKENGALLPWLIVVLEVTLFRGVWRNQQRRTLVGACWLICFMPLLGLALLFFLSPEVVTRGYAHREFSLDERLLTQGRILWHYIYWLIMPDITAMGFQHDDIALSRSLLDPHATWVALLAWLVVLLSAWRLRNAFPLFLFAVLFYLVSHAIESTVLALEMVYEHRTYMPAIGIAIGIAGALGWVVNALPQLRLSIAALGILSILTALLFARTQTWSDEIPLSRINVENHPASSRSHFFYGNALFKRYQNREELQLGPQEERNLAVASRYYFEKMHEIDKRDVAPLVMLYQIDSMLFPTMPDREDWLGKLGILLQTRRLQASDYSALSGLVKYFSHAASESDSLRFLSILDELIERYPDNAALIIFKYQLLATVDSVTTEDLLQLLGLAERVNPQYLETYPSQLVEYHKAGDWASIHEVMRAWLKQDASRWHLPAIRSAFSQQ